MPDEYRPYGVTHHADAELTTADALVGERIGPPLANALVGSISAYSTTPYKPPRKTWFGCTGNASKCKARPIIGTDQCWFHTPKAPE